MHMVKKLLIKFFSWRLAITLIGLLAVFIFPFREGFTLHGPQFKWSDLSLMWASFDGQHYLKLARFGYNHSQTGFMQAFFPVYPTVTRYLANLLPNYLFSALALSHLSFFAALYFLVRLIKLDYSQKTAHTTIMLLLLFPTSFFFASVYSESLFLLITVLVFYTARKKQWLLSSVLVAIATATRLTGAFLIPALLVEFWISNEKDIKKSFQNPSWIWFLLTPIGLISYMLFLQRSVGDPFYFATIQPLFGAQREVGRMILLHQVFYRYAKMLVFIDHLSPLFFTVLLEALTGGLFLGLTVLLFKRSRLSYAAYVLPSYLLPTITGTFSSMPRYVLVLFPAFILMGKWLAGKNKKTKTIVYLVLAILSFFTVSLFTRGYFIG